MRVDTVALSCLLILASTASAQDRLPSRTLNELLSRSEAAVIGVVKKDAMKFSSAVFVKAPFTSVKVIKDASSGELDAVLMARCRRSHLPGDRFLLLRAKDRSGELQWKVKLAMTDETVQHLVVLSKTDLREVKRLEFFYDFLEHSDPIISVNAGLEFLLASDETFASFSQRIDASEIRERLAQEILPVHRRRLYLAMLAKCGNASDADWIKHQLAKPVDTSGSLDAYLAAYVALKGEAGLEFLDERYLAAANAEWISAYNTNLALRFASDHPQLGIGVQRLHQSCRLLLDHPELIDIAIASLTRVKDWPSMDRIVDVGKASDDPSVHVATINFLRRCPRENANQHLDEMAKRYPKAFQRAISFFPSEHKPASIRWTGRPGGC